MEPIIINHFSRRKELIQMLKERGAKVGAEIGTDHGQYAEQLCAGIPGLKLYCVDPWVAYVEGEQSHSQEEMDNIQAEARRRLKPYQTVIYPGMSMDCLKWIPNESLDFVFIDGNHEFSFVYEDIVEWTKKVKPGGIVCGHDYKVDPVNNYGVIEAVQKYTKENHIAPWFILHVGGRLVDCWCFIKQ